MALGSDVSPGPFGPARGSRAVDITGRKVRRKETAWQAQTDISLAA